MKISEEKIISYLISKKLKLQRNDLFGIFMDAGIELRGCLVDYFLTRTSLPIFKFMDQIPEYFMQTSEDVQDLVIPGNIKKIGSFAFAKSKLKTIKLENGVETLGNSCFSGCKELEAVDLADTISTIPNNCFDGCTNLKKVFLPDGIKTIGADAFAAGADDLEIIANYRDKDKIRAKKSDYEFLKQHLKFTHNN